jgi:hypothetical protein
VLLVQRVPKEFLDQPEQQVQLELMEQTELMEQQDQQALPE